MSRILIIGGGAIGLSLGYHLTKRCASDVTLLERNQLTSGTSWHAAGIVGPLRATPNMTKLAMAALDVFPELEAETGLSTGYKRTGGYWLAREEARLDELHRIADLGITQGLWPRVVNASDIPLPMLDLKDHAGALYVPEDANVNPVDLCMAYARAARDRGLKIREGVQVKRLLVEKDRTSGVELSDGSQLAADHVVLATGAWSRELAATAGVALPLQAVEHMYVVTEPIPDLPNPFPVIRDLDRGIYIKGDAGKLVIGGFEPNAKCWDAYGPEGDRAFLELADDWDQFSPFLEAALDLCPDLESAGIKHFMNGPESFTADTRPLVGETSVDGLYVAAGMNSVGVMSSAGIGRALADWIIDGHPSMDMREVDVARIDPKTATPSHMEARMKEAVSDLFALHWPYKQPTAGRGLRKTALHDNWAKAGAMFGATAGWERGLWYGDPQPYSVGAQGWWPIARAEATVMAEGTALIDLSPFTKLDITGAEALVGLNRLSTAQLDVELGRSVYTQLLNARGGIEMDVTITRIGAEAFHLTSGAATRARDLAYLRRNLPNGTHIADVTEQFCTIGVMGAGSRDLLEGLGSLPETPFGHSRKAYLADVECRATRVSFVGELGWELTVANAEAPTLFNALKGAGGHPLGHFTLDGCRLEKGFRHWGHELGPEVTPLEAGLGFTIDWNKDSIGKSALQAQREDGLHKRLVLMQVEGDALMLHDEPVYEAGRHVGLTTSAARGPRTGLNLCFAMVQTAPGKSLAETCARNFSVRVAGRDYPAIPLIRAPFDPKGERMRA
ncbi:FAD-dependent oxidoreductase [Roseibium sp. RKSG952]|uniref:GcvT family protein n=1 Tax=Roseibium sp. RKSG952 TaxID=2529384 RepID=UPI0012BC257E|nr:FAD-dependent oxidoreductase [Roseibium sp. RKSG952]MTI01923.1 FAD-dependent oxidoreductase [Roseibium sp. RKSG952]